MIYIVYHYNRYCVSLYLMTQALDVNMILRKAATVSTPVLDIIIIIIIITIILVIILVIIITTTTTTIIIIIR